MFKNFQVISNLKLRKKKEIEGESKVFKYLCLNLKYMLEYEL